MKRLLRLVRSEAPQIELIAFMHECPHLMRNPEVRNFFDALFFNFLLDDSKLATQYFNKSFFETLPLQIDREIKRLETFITDSLQGKKIQDIQTLQSRIDTILYYHEMKEKTKSIYLKLNRPINQFTSSINQLTHLRQICQDRVELQGSLAYAARVHLKALLANNTQANILPEILKDYALMHYPPNEYNSDSYATEEIQHTWQVIAKKCEESKLNLGPFFDFLCYAKDLPLDKSEWQQLDGGLYGNALYEVNLKTLDVSKRNEAGTLEFLPLEITQDPHFQKIIGDKIADLRVRVQEVKGKKLYLLQDKTGCPLQIEWDKGQLTFYKQFMKDKWLQILPENPFSSDNKKNFKDFINSKTPSLKELLKAFFSFRSNVKETQSAFSIFTNYMICVDPAHKSSFYCIDTQGNIAFQLHVKETKQGLRLEQATDHRTSPPSIWQINSATQLNHTALTNLISFENKGNMILWSQKNTLKKIELPRYGLTFNYDKGQLICDHAALKGYTVDLSATLKEKKNLVHAIVLSHPDPTKPKKLLVPEADAIVSKNDIIFPKGKGFAKIALFFEQIKNLIAFMKGQPLLFDQRLTYEIDPKKDHIAFSLFDLRPYTGEICEHKDHWESHLLQLIKQALKTDQPAVAGDLFKRLKLKPNQLDQTLLNQLTNFIFHQKTDSESAAALKIKLCLSLKKCLKEKGNLKKPLQQKLNLSLLNLGKIFFEHRRKIPNTLQLNQTERLQLAKLFKKQEPNYYEKHLKVYFIESGTSFDLTLPLIEEDSLDLQIDNWKQTRAPFKVEEQIKTLEKELSPSTALLDSELAYTIPLSTPSSLLVLSAKDEEKLFRPIKKDLPTLNLMAFKAQTSCENQALQEYQAALNQFKTEENQRPSYLIQITKKKLKQFLANQLISQKATYENQVTFYQHQIESLLRHSDKQEEQLAIYAGKQSMASLDEVRQAFAHNQLEDLQKKGRLPSSLDFVNFKETLIHYFDSLSRRNAAEAAIKLTQEILTRGNPENKEEWQSMSEALHRLLTIKRHYDPHQDPRLLIFEAQQFINLKPLDGGLDQLYLLEALVKNPYAVIQAPTGAGKTAVLSVMRSLLKANGKNLVVQKVLPSLYQQTYEKLESVLGGLYGISIYALRFNLKMRLSYSEKTTVTNAEGKEEEKIIEHSLFKNMYRDLLDTIKNKGCVLTDYKSLPLLEEMFFKVGQQLLEKHEQGLESAPLIEEHYTYLRKILILLKNKADENMDEFDQPNRPIQKIQVDMGIGSHALPEFMIDHSLSIYDTLIEDPELGLIKNIQSDLSNETRQKIIENHALKMAQQLAQDLGNSHLKEPLLNYLLGKNEDVLTALQNLPLKVRDQVALYKDQFSIYLPLTLKSKEGSRYARSGDGSKTLPCYNGEKHDAKFGTLLEQINYTIQDYLQAGITAYDLKPYLNNLKQHWDESENSQIKEQVEKKLKKLFPDFSFRDVHQMMQTPTGTQTLIQIINQDHSKIKIFLNGRLRQIKTSGALISMDPQNTIEMSRAISGVSATMGAPASLHRQFQVDATLNRQIQASMIYRLRKRAEQETIIQYDPENPYLMLSGDKHTLIDGAGAFTNAQQAAQALKTASPSLQQVGYHKEDETIDWIGQPTGELTKTGFFFSQPHTRGTDIPLASDAKAILTLNEKDGIREFFQKEGRLRQERQRYQLAMPKYQGIQTVSQEIAHAITQDALTDAQDIFRKCKQELNCLLRTEIKKRLLEAETPADFISLFQNEGWRNYFIATPEPHFEKAGSYFEAHQHIQFVNQKPGEVLAAYQVSLIQKAQVLGLKNVIDQIQKTHYSDELLAKMPENVAPLGAAQGELEIEVHVEQEEESEQEQELEMETQNEQTKTDQRVLGQYPIRLKDDDKGFHSVKTNIFSAYHSTLQVTEAFLPFSRQATNQLHQRHPFDENMYRIGEVRFDIKKYWDKEISNFQYKIEKIVIDDPLEDVNIKAPTPFIYDIRTDRIIQECIIYPGELKLCPEFIARIAEIKFLDGRISGYNPAELEALEIWLRQNNPNEMKNHLLNDILRYRYQDKQLFVGSQLHHLFERLVKETV
jgi:Protein of unknown function (DUF3638)